MKKIVNGKELQEKILESIYTLCGTVKETLGPKGNNVLIDHSTFSPFITNDGVTIAKNIESDDETLGAILEIIKEASIKTNEEVGDGTTTTLVLLESLYKQSIEYVNKGISSIILKKELEEVLEIILKKLQNQKRKATNKDLKNIAIISAGDDTLGTFAYEAINKVKQKEAITIKEIPENKTSVSYRKGYTCETSLVSPYFLKDKNVLIYKDAYILIMNTPLIDLENISFLLNDCLKTKKEIAIIANYYDEQLVSELVSLSLTEEINICLLKIEEYGMHVSDILKDLEAITGAKIIEQENNITAKDIGRIENIEITKEKVRVDFKTTERIKNHIKKLKEKENFNDLEKEFYTNRLAMFSKGTAEIKLGAPTKTERIEKRMSLEDALCALSVANEGVLLGGGTSLLQIANELETRKEASQIWKETLKKPFQQILKNAGCNIETIEIKMEKEKYKNIYNVSNETWEHCASTNVIDPYLVVLHALINATSIASMLLTTTSLIVNEYKNNNDKESEYNNW